MHCNLCSEHVICVNPSSVVHTRTYIYVVVVLSCVCKVYGGGVRYDRPRVATTRILSFTFFPVYYIRARVVGNTSNNTRVRRTTNLRCIIYCVQNVRAAWRPGAHGAMVSRTRRVPRRISTTVETRQDQNIPRSGQLLLYSMHTLSRYIIYTHRAFNNYRLIAGLPPRHGWLQHVRTNGHKKWFLCV